MSADKEEDKTNSKIAEQHDQDSKDPVDADDVTTLSGGEEDSNIAGETFQADEVVQDEVADVTKATPLTAKLTGVIAVQHEELGQSCLE